MSLRAVVLSKTLLCCNSIMLLNYLFLSLWRLKYLLTLYSLHTRTSFDKSDTLFVQICGQIYSLLIKIQPDATVCRYLFTAKSLYMFRVSQHPSSGVLETVTAASGTGHNIGRATSLQRGLIGPRWREVARTSDLLICRTPPLPLCHRGSLIRF